jgi:hypothetical protein
MDNTDENKHLTILFIVTAPAAVNHIKEFAPPMLTDADAIISIRETILNNKWNGPKSTDHYF